jgi:hypothetical protein
MRSSVSLVKALKSEKSHIISYMRTNDRANAYLASMCESEVTKRRTLGVVLALVSQPLRAISSRERSASNSSSASTHPTVTNLAL